MSSSRRSSPSRISRKTGACPTCGSNRVVPVTEDIVIRLRGRRYRCEALPHERCAACGELILGIDTARRLDALILRGARRRVA